MIPTPLLILHNLTAGYDAQPVLRDISLTVYDRDFLGIIGPNGGGKTTLIKCILGLLPHTAGSIQFYQNGQPTDSITMGTSAGCSSNSSDVKACFNVFLDIMDSFIKR